MNQRLWQKPVNIYIYILATILFCILGMARIEAYADYNAEYKYTVFANGGHFSDGSTSKNGSFAVGSGAYSSNLPEVPIREGYEFQGYVADAANNPFMFDNSKAWDAIYCYKHGISKTVEWDFEFPYDQNGRTATRHATFDTSTGEVTISSVWAGGDLYKQNTIEMGLTLSYVWKQNRTLICQPAGGSGNYVGVKYWYALWSKKLGYNVTFNVNGGSTTIASQTVSTITLPSPGSKTGYTFDGWYNGNTRIGGAGTSWTPTADATITAKWKPRTDTKYVVKHQLMNVNGSGYTLKETETLKGTTDASVSPATKSYTGFTAPSKQTVTISADGSRVVTYNYSRNKYAFKIGSDTSKYSHGINTSGSSANGSYYYGATITLKAAPKAGYTWSKWSDGNTSQSRTFTMPANALTITPYGSLITYSIRYNTYEGNLQKEKTVTYTVESPDIVLENPTLDGKEFLGWSDWNDPTPKKPYTIPKGTTGDLVISANWRTDKTGYVDNVFTGESYVKSNRFTIKM